MVSANRYATKNNFVTVRRTWPSTTGMLAGTTSIKNIIAGNQIYIADSGLSKSNAAGYEYGMWATGEFTYDNEYTSADTLWFDTTDHLFINTTTARYTRNERDVYKRQLKEITGINNWDVTRVQDFSGMFDMSILGEAGGQLGDTLLGQIGKWTLGTAVPGGQVITMANMFRDLRNMTTLDGLKDWDTSRVGDFTGMFSSSKNDKGVTYTYSAGRLEKTEGTKGMLLKDITAINNWNITAVTSLEQMFENGIRIEKVDLSSWNMRGKHLTNMFKNCASINEIKMGLLSVLEDTAFGDDMFFIQTVPTNASGSSNKVVDVYWRDRINKDQAETTFGGLIWQAGHYGGAWIQHQASLRKSEKLLLTFKPVCPYLN